MLLRSGSGDKPPRPPLASLPYRQQRRAALARERGSVLSQAFDDPAAADRHLTAIGSVIHAAGGAAASLPVEATSAAHRSGRVVQPVLAPRCPARWLPVPLVPSRVLGSAPPAPDCRSRPPLDGTAPKGFARFA